MRLLDPKPFLLHLPSHHWIFTERLSPRRVTGKRAIGAGLKARGVEGAAVADALACVEIDDDHAMIALWWRRFGAPPVKLLRNPPVDDSSRA